MSYYNKILTKVKENLTTSFTILFVRIIDIQKYEIITELKSLVKLNVNLSRQNNSYNVSLFNSMPNRILFLNFKSKFGKPSYIIYGFFDILSHPYIFGRSAISQLVVHAHHDGCCTSKFPNNVEKKS